MLPRPAAMLRRPAAAWRRPAATARRRPGPAPANEGPQREVKPASEAVRAESALFVEKPDESGRSDRAIRLAAHLGQLGPVDLSVETYAEPAAVADVGWAEVAIGVAGHVRLLGAERRGAPQVGELQLVVAVVPAGDERLLATDEPRRRSVAGPLGHLGQSGTDGPYLGQGRVSTGRHGFRIGCRHAGWTDPP